MNADVETEILAILWHSPYEFVVSGGFRRTQEILKRAPRDVEVFAVDSSPTMVGDPPPNVHVEEYSFPSSLRALEGSHFMAVRLLEWLFALVGIAWRCVRLKLRGARFDCVYVPSSEIVPVTVAGVFAKYLFRCRLVPCNTNIEYYPRPVRRLLAWLHNRSDVVITISEDLAASLRRNGIKAPIALNAVGLDVEQIDSSLAGSESDKKYEAIFVGRHDQGKGILDLLNAWAEVKAALPGARLVTVGSITPIYEPQVEGLIERLGLRDDVLMRGVVDEDTKFKLMKESKVCLFPSYLEGWGIVPQEAMACGLPVVLYDLPVYEENIAPCSSVFPVPTGDTGALARRAIELLSDDSYIESGAAGPEFVRRFGWEDVADREFDILSGRVHGAATGV